MVSAERFLFDRRFDHGLSAGPCPDGRGEPPARPAAARYTDEDLQQARADGRAEGRTEMLAELRARQEFECRLQATADAVAAELARLHDRSAEAAAEAERGAVRVAAAIARKLLPRLYREHACAEVESLVESVLHGLPADARLIVHVAPAMLEELAPPLQRAIERHGLDGRLAAVAEPALQAGDCRLEWSGGGLLRDQSSLWLEIDAVIEHAIAAPGRCTGGANA